MNEPSGVSIWQNETHDLNLSPLTSVKPYESIAQPSKTCDEMSRSWESEGDVTAERSFIKVQTTILATLLFANALIASFFMTRLTTTPSDVKNEVLKIHERLDRESVIESTQARNDVLRASLERSKEAIVELDDNGLVILWSDGAEELIGEKRENVEGYGVKWMMPVGSAGKHVLAFEHAMKSNKQGIRKQVIDCELPKVGPVRIHTWVRPGHTAISRIERRDKRRDE